MITIRNSTFIRFNDEVSVERMELDIDSAEELPETDYFEGKEIAQGSIAWDITNGEFYGLTSEGEWVSQSGSES